MNDEFEDRQKQRDEKLEIRKRENADLAACYARVFLGSEDGKRVLSDLRKKFGVGRMSFQKNEQGRYDYLAAAVIDGERHVLSEIEGALNTGAPGMALSEQ